MEAWMEKPLHGKKNANEIRIYYEKCKISVGHFNYCNKNNIKSKINVIRFHTTLFFLVCKQVKKYTFWHTKPNV